jgi:hypothetical protein
MINHYTTWVVIIRVREVGVSDEESVGWVYSLEAGRGIDIMVGSM